MKSEGVPSNAKLKRVMTNGIGWLVFTLIFVLAVIGVKVYVSPADAMIPTRSEAVKAPIACNINANLEEVIFSLPNRFDGTTELAGEVRFKFTGAGEPVFYTLVIADGAARVISGKLDNPVLKITCPADVYLDVEFGRTTPATAIATGDLTVNDQPLARSFLAHFPLYYVACGF